jgi:hypothetical protein
MTSLYFSIPQKIKNKNLSQCLVMEKGGGGGGCCCSSSPCGRLNVPCDKVIECTQNPNFQKS